MIYREAGMQASVSGRQHNNPSIERIRTYEFHPEIFTFVALEGSQCVLTFLLSAALLAPPLSTD